MTRLAILTAVVAMSVGLWVGIGLTAARPLIGVPVLAATLIALYLAAKRCGRPDRQTPALPPDPSATERQTLAANLRLITAAYRREQR